jgi:hypothetical protein
VAHDVRALDAELVEELEDEAGVVARIPGPRRRVALPEARQVHRHELGRPLQRREDRADGLDVRSPAVEDHDRGVAGGRLGALPPHIAHLLRADPDGLGVL